MDASLIPNVLGINSEIIHDLSQNLSIPIMNPHKQVQYFFEPQQAIASFPSILPTQTTPILNPIGIPTIASKEIRSPKSTNKIGSVHIAENSFKKS